MIRSRKRVKSSLDPNQAKFGSDGTVKNLAKIKDEEVDFNETYFCPHCLCQDEFRKFYVSTGIVQCPDCQRNMRTKSLTKWKNATPEDFAQWVFTNALYGYWQKVDWNIWQKRLAKLGFAQQFWGAYGTLKAEVLKEEGGTTEEDAGEQYQDYLKESSKTP